MSVLADAFWLTPGKDATKQARADAIAREVFDTIVGLPTVRELSGDVASRHSRMAIAVLDWDPDGDVEAQIREVAAELAGYVRLWVEERAEAGKPLVGLAQLTGPTTHRLSADGDGLEAIWDGCGVDADGLLVSPPRATRTGPWIDGGPA